MTKGKKKKEEEKKGSNPEMAEPKKIEPDPIVIPNNVSDDREFEDSIPRAAKFIDPKTNTPSEEWIRMNELVYTALDYAESMPFSNEVIRCLHRYYISFKAGKEFDAVPLFNQLSNMKLDDKRNAFRRLMGEKLDEYLLAKKLPQK